MKPDPKYQLAIGAIIVFGVVLPWVLVAKVVVVWMTGGNP